LQRINEALIVVERDLTDARGLRRSQLVHASDLYAPEPTRVLLHSRARIFARHLRIATRVNAGEALNRIVEALKRATETLRKARD